MQDWKSDTMSTRSEAHSEAHQEERPHISALLRAKRAINECVLIHTHLQRDVIDVHLQCPLLLCVLYSVLPCREKLVDFQSRVSRPLLARYFYSCQWQGLCNSPESAALYTALCCYAGLSYCRHMSKARHRVSHMVKPDLSPPKPAELEHPFSGMQWEAVKYSTDVRCPKLCRSAVHS